MSSNVVTTNKIGVPWSGDKPDNRRKYNTDKKVTKKGKK